MRRHGKVGWPARWRTIRITHSPRREVDSCQPSPAVTFMSIFYIAAAMSGLFCPRDDNGGEGEGVGVGEITATMTDISSGII